MKAKCLSRAAELGFTLIELMVVVAIVGILAAIAYPSYAEHVRKGNRADAEASLMQLAQFMERYYTGTGRYSQTSGKTDAPNNPAPPFPVNRPYTFSVDITDSGTGYTLKATPNSPGAMANDRCGTLTLKNTGEKGQASTATSADCWRR